MARGSVSREKNKSRSVRIILNRLMLKVASPKGQ